FKSSSNTMSIVSRPFTGSSLVRYPIDEKTSTASAGASKKKFPSESVTVPVDVPFIITFTPGIVIPSTLDVTCPFTRIKNKACCFAFSANNRFGKFQRLRIRHPYLFNHQKVPANLPQL